MYLSLLANPALDTLSLTAREALRKEEGDASGEGFFTLSASRFSSVSPATPGPNSIGHILA